MWQRMSTELLQQGHTWGKPWQGPVDGQGRLDMSPARKPPWKENWPSNLYILFGGKYGGFMMFYVVLGPGVVIQDKYNYLI